MYNASMKMKAADYTREVLDAIGHENEKEGIKWTQEFMKLWDKKQWEENQFKQEKLQKKRRKRMEYHYAVAKMMHEEAQDLLTDVPLGYSFWGSCDELGVVLHMRDRWGEEYQRAFKPEGTPKIDFQAVVSYLASALDTVDTIERERKENLETLGFILPG